MVRWRNLMIFSKGNCIAREHLDDLTMSQYSRRSHEFQGSLWAFLRRNIELAKTWQISNDSRRVSHMFLSALEWEGHGNVNHHAGGTEFLRHASNHICQVRDLCSARACLRFSFRSSMRHRSRRFGPVRVCRVPYPPSTSTGRKTFRSSSIYTCSFQPTLGLLCRAAFPTSKGSFVSVGVKWPY